MKALGYTILTLLIIAAGWGYEAMRWKFFESITHTHINFWLWLFFMGGK